MSARIQQMLLLLFVGAAAGGCSVGRLCWWACDFVLLTARLHWLLWTLSLNLRAGESSSETHSLSVRDGLFPLAHLSPPIVPHLFVRTDCKGVIGPKQPPCFLCFSAFLGLSSDFSCVNSFVLSDTCESARLWAFVSSAVFSPLSSEHLCVAGFTVCRGFKRAFPGVISSSVLTVSLLIFKYPFLFPKATNQGCVLISLACEKPSASSWIFSVTCLEMVCRAEAHSRFTQRVASHWGVCG